MKSTILSAILLAVSTFVYAQKQESKTVKRINITDFYIQPGLFSESNTLGSLADFRTLAPQSVLLNNNLTDYSSSRYSLTSSPVLSVMLGIQFRDKQKATYKTNPLLRVGFSYFSGTSLSNNLWKEDRKTYDTFTSPESGQSIYLDSVTTKNYGMNYSSQQLRFDGSLLYRIKPGERWSFFAGIGITAGVSINAYTDIHYSEFSWTEARFPSGNYSYINSYSTSYNSKSEKFRNKNNFGILPYIPLGVDFRLGKKSEFWKRTHIFFELRPAINITSIPELRTTRNATMQHGFGLRISSN